MPDPDPPPPPAPAPAPDPRDAVDPAALEGDPAVEEGEDGEGV